jgi:excinuclease ABC subunit C
MLLIDGGRGQLAVVERAIGEAEGRDGSLPLRDTALVALSKGEETDLAFRPGRKNPLNLKQGDPVLLFLQNIRDNAHRYVLSRQKRSRKRQTFQSDLESLPGIGRKTARQLWDRFGSLEGILRLTRQDLEQLPGFGPKRAEKVLEGIKSLEAGEGRQ